MKFENSENNFNSGSAPLPSSAPPSTPSFSADHAPHEDEQVADKAFAVYSDEEKSIIKGAYRNLLRSISMPMSDEDKKNIRKAFELALEAHAQQRRKSGEPYILHPIEVARICAQEIGLGATAVIAAILHDIVEDTDITLKEIKEKFGDRISLIVDGLTKLDNTYEMDCPQAENLRRVLATLVEDVRVVLIKMADRLHNMRTLGSMPHHKQLKIAAETDYIYAPLAHRLGLYSIKTELQDLILKVMDRTVYNQIAADLNATKRERNAFIDEFIAPIRERLSEICKYPIRIVGRPKSIHSIWNKIKTKNVPFHEIYDLFAIRIILDIPPLAERRECFGVFATITEIYEQVPERLKDWISMPKSNGYESLHTTLVSHTGQFVEVQIRSKRMDDIAERGFAAHWKYKGVQTQGKIKRNQKDIYETWFTKVREMLEDLDSKDAVAFLMDFKASNLFAEEVFVYTPKGELRILPKGASALDFAFEIHSEVGAQCRALNVNGRLVRLDYTLKTGDRVEVITGKNEKPSESWLKYVITSKAKSRIRQSLREEEKHQFEFGRETLLRKLDALKTPLDFENAAETLMHKLNFRSKADLYHAISIQRIDVTQELKKFKVEKGKLIFIEDIRPTAAPSFLYVPPKETKENLELYIDDEPASRFFYQFASCCNPVKGDDVFAYVGSENGYKIHRTACPNATNLMSTYGYRVRKATWGKSNSAFVTKLLVKGIDGGTGVIERVSGQISHLKLNIKSFNIIGEQGFFNCEIVLEVNNTQQLEAAIQGLLRVADVSSVERLD